MNHRWRWMLAMALAVLPVLGWAQGKTALATDREKISYFVGMDVGRALKPVAPDLDLAVLETGIAAGLAGAESGFTPEQARNIGETIGKRVASRAGQQVPGGMPELSRQQASRLVGSDVGHSLRRVPEQLDVGVLMQAIKTQFDGGFPLLGEAEAGHVRELLKQRAEQAARDAGRRNLADGEAFLARNKAAKDVQTTASGLQYQVLRAGKGARPAASDTVRVHYQGTLLDGTVFDSSYQRNEPAQFALNQVIPGWTEGVALMPVGAKYRFWIPARLGYGESGTPDGSIGPNATLVFEVELLDIVH